MAIIFAPTSEIIEYLVNRNNYNSIINLLHRTDRLLHTYNNYIQYIVVIIIRDWVKIERLKGPVWLARWQGNRLWPNLHVTRPQLFSPLIFSSRSTDFSSLCETDPLFILSVLFDARNRIPPILPTSTTTRALAVVANRNWSDFAERRIPFVLGRLPARVACA